MMMMCIDEVSHFGYKYDINLSTSKSNDYTRLGLCFANVELNSEKTNSYSLKYVYLRYENIFNYIAYCSRISSDCAGFGYIKKL